MAVSAKALQVAHVVRVAATVERNDVIDFQAPGCAALAAPVAVALEHRAADLKPTPAVEAGMVVAHK